MKMTQTELNAILEKHSKWLLNEKGGERADLSGADLIFAKLKHADLRYANLSDANLSYADLSGADLSFAKLKHADLRYANLSDANLSYADLSGADLSDAKLIDANLNHTDLSDAKLNHANLVYADLCEADLTGANLNYADLRYANLSGAKLIGANLSGIRNNYLTAFYAMTCPEEGAFIGFKKANGMIVKLMIPEDAKRSSATSRKCRCDKAKVLSITKIDGSAYEENNVASDRDPGFIYEIGKEVSVPDFDENRWNECSTGIHFFITRDEAVNW